MPLQVVRSSGRIPKEIPILLIGNDLNGRVFSEPTKTVVLSLHGAGILSCHKLSPEQELILRWPQYNKEADIRIVGRVGSSGDGHIYGVAFFDPQLNFWGMDFPPITPIEREMGLMTLACTSCNALEKIDESSIEADICATNDGVMRFCKRCGASTLWKPTAGLPATPSAAELGPTSAAVDAAATASPASPTDSSPTFHAQEHIPAEASSSEPSEPTSVLTLPSPEPATYPRINRRKHPRVKVNYSACVRHADRADDIVQCEDMSKGGLRFKSRYRYYPQCFIEVAVPYEQDQPAIFVPAQIVYVEKLPEQGLYRCGVEFLHPTKPRDSF